MRYKEDGYEAERRKKKTKERRQKKRETEEVKKGRSLASSVRNV